VVNISREEYQNRLSLALRGIGDFEALPTTMTGASAMRFLNPDRRPDQAPAS